MRQKTALTAAAALVAALLALGCGSPDVKVSAKNRTPGKTTPALPGLPEETPVTVEYLGLSADKEHARYRIHVETDKPIEQVDVGLVYTDGEGKQQRGTFVWRNTVNSTRQPIEKGKAYVDEAPVGRGATGVVCKVLHVAYKDGTPGNVAR